MRMLLRVSFPHEPFNTMVREGKAGETIGRVLEEIKPEAVYFTEHNGQRAAILIVDMAESSSVPAIAEPLFLSFGADVSFNVVMSPEDLQKAGLDELGEKWA